MYQFVKGREMTQKENKSHRPTARGDPASHALLEDIEPRLAEYYDLCQHTGTEGDPDDLHNGYELLCAPSVRLLQTYPLQRR